VTARTPMAQAIYDETVVLPVRAGRGRDWSRLVPRTEEEAGRELAAHPDDPGPTPEAEARWGWETAGADRLYDDPGDPLLDDDGPYAGNPRWAGGI